MQQQQQQQQQLVKIAATHWRNYELGDVTHWRTQELLLGRSVLLLL